MGKGTSLLANIDWFQMDSSRVLNVQRLHWSILHKKHTKFLKDSFLQLYWKNPRVLTLDLSPNRSGHRHTLGLLQLVGEGTCWQILESQSLLKLELRAAQQTKHSCPRRNTLLAAKALSQNGYGSTDPRPLADVFWVGFTPVRKAAEAITLTPHACLLAKGTYGLWYSFALGNVDLAAGAHMLIYMVTYRVPYIVIRTLWHVHFDTHILTRTFWHAHFDTHILTRTFWHTHFDTHILTHGMTHAW